MAGDNTKARNSTRIPELQLQRFNDRGYAYAYSVFDGVRKRYSGTGGDKAIRNDDDLAAARREHEQTLARWLSNGRRFPKVAGEGTTIDEVCTEFLAYKTREHGEGWATVKGGGGRVVYALRALRKLFGTEPAAEFDSVKLENVRFAMIDESKLCRVEINARIGAIRSAYRWAGRQKLAPRGIAIELSDLEDIDAGKFGTREGEGRREVPFEAVLSTLPHLPPPFDVVVELLYRTGARPSEILRLRPRDFDRSDAQQWVASLDEHKTSSKGKARVLVFEAEAQRALARFMDRAPGKPLFCPEEGHAERKVFRARMRTRKLYPCDVLRYERERAERAPRTFPKTYDPNTLYQAVRAAIKTAKATAWAPYQIRHAVGTEVEERWGLEVAGVLLGHSQGRVTERYCHGVIESTKRASKTALGRPSLRKLDEQSGGLVDHAHTVHIKLGLDHPYVVIHDATH